MACFRELGPDWLMQTLCEDPRHRAPRLDNGFFPHAMGTPNAAGEQVDLLNAMDDEPQAASHEATDDEEGNNDDDDDEVNIIQSIRAIIKPQNQIRYDDEPGQIQSGSKHATYPESRQTCDSEINHSLPNTWGSVAVQEQGLDFIRNLICGPESTEMIDFLFHELGQEKFFDMLTNFLRPRSWVTLEDRNPSGLDGQHLPPHPEIVVAVCFILIHLAAGLSRHRQLLFAHANLMKLLVPLFTHASIGVRVNCAWIVINLTSPEEQGDKLQCKGRAQELSRLGVVEQLHRLEGDNDLDVRERARQALQQIDELLQR